MDLEITHWAIVVVGKRSLQAMPFLSLRELQAELCNSFIFSLFFAEDNPKHTVQVKIQ